MKAVFETSNFFHVELADLPTKLHCLIDLILLPFIHLGDCRLTAKSFY